MKPMIVLASASPQRKSLLTSLGLPFEVMPSAVDEVAHPEGDPEERARELACLKARDVASRMPGRYVIGCDTLVVDPYGALLEKPADEAEARAMLKQQSNGVSIVHSGLCVLAPDGAEHRGISSSSVRFRELSEADVDWWIGTGLWQDRSGSFQIDGPGQLMIRHIEGDWTGIVGLPVFLLGELLTEAGYPLYQ
jgi:septum formation protein